MQATSRAGASGAAIGARRLAAQRLAAGACRRPEEVVAWLGAVQAQDYPAARWALGLRLREGRTSDASVEEAIAGGAIVRTHALRGTWQLIAPRDVRWVLSLVRAAIAGRAASRHRQLGLDAATLRKSGAVLERVLGESGELARDEVAAALEGAGIPASGPRLSHLLAHAEHEGLICSGGLRGKRLTYALLDQRVPDPGLFRDRAEAVAELARRYFVSRGPATLSDFTWWSGLGAREARAGVEAAGSSLSAEVLGGTTFWFASRGAGAGEGTRAAEAAHLLPAFDEYLVAYRDRGAVLEPGHATRVNAGGGLLGPCVLIGGRVVATWRREVGRKEVVVEVSPFGRMGGRQREVVAAAVERYARFLGVAGRVAFLG
jgi:hypothetical protein